MRAFVGEDVGTGVELVRAVRACGTRRVGSLRVAGRRRTCFVEADLHLLSSSPSASPSRSTKSRLDDDTARLDRLKLNFVAVASHELRTPAAAVYGALATLRERGDSLSPEIREQLRTPH